MTIERLYKITNFYTSTFFEIPISFRVINSWHIKQDTWYVYKITHLKYSASIKCQIIKHISTVKIENKNSLDKKTVLMRFSARDVRVIVLQL